MKIVDFTVKFTIHKIMIQGFEASKNCFSSKSVFSNLRAGVIGITPLTL